MRREEKDFEPTPQEIIDGCHEAQSHWSKREEMTRRGVRFEPFELKVMHVNTPGKRWD